MKKTIINFLILAIVGFSSCKKEDPVTNPIVNTADEIRSDVGVQFPFFACNTPIYAFNASGKYSLAMTDGAGYRKFGIPGTGTLNFQTIDKVNLEFSGSYADKDQKHKLYYIKRTDNLFLTTYYFVGSLGYTVKQTGADLSRQKWLVNNLGGNKYNIICYALEPCSWIHTWYDNGDYKISSVTRDYGATLPQNKTTIYILPEATLPPNGN